MERRRTRLLYLASEDWAFCSNRLALAVAARDAGYSVGVATRVGRHATAIRSEGLRLFPLQLKRGFQNPTRELGSIREILNVYRTFRPDLVHHLAIKPMLYGSVAARLTGVRSVVNTLTGRGFVFVSDRWQARAIRPAIRCGLRAASSGHGVRVVLQNPDDIEVWGAGERKFGETFRLIRGSGVDTRHFTPMPEPAPPVVVTLPSRLLWDKGVGEFVNAARRLRERGVRAVFRLVGDSDDDNPSAIPREILRNWSDDGLIVWQGWQEEMRTVYADCHIVCLPSYSEGLPKALLEAAASGRPLVSTDVPGCREIVRHGRTGLLVPARDSGALAAALETLIDSPELRRQYGRAARQAAVDEFSIDIVVNETFAVYRDLLASDQAAGADAAYA